jgi:hypothetical protein
MRRPALALVAGLLSAAPVHGAGSFPAHRGDSPWSFTVIAEPSSRFVVNDTDSASIDVYLFGSQGPIVIDVPIRRYVGPTDANGKLLNADDLVRRGIVGKTVKVTLPAFDVDTQTFPVADCDGDDIDDQLLNEVDKLYLNDEELGTLKGNNELWLSQSFDVPVGKIKFPSAPGATAINRFRVEVDTANREVVLSSGAIGCEVWAVAIDWVGMKFEASSPVVMVHGIRSSGAAFQNFRAGLVAEQVRANDISIALADPAAPDPVPPGCPGIPYNNSYPDHVAQLRNLVPAIAERFGSETIHFVTHSKGGLDTRGFLSSTVSGPIPIRVGTMGGQPVRQDFEARSLVTLDTPYGGSVLAKYGVEARQLGWIEAVRGGVNVAAAKGFEGSYYCDLTPLRASAFVASTVLPSATQTASVAADADCNGDRQLTNGATCASSGAAETADFSGGSVGAADKLYQLTGRIADVTITVVPRSFRPDEIRVAETPNAAFQPNDAIVTRTSAALYTLFPITGWHHLNVHAERNARAIATDGQADGLVDWRNR